MKTLNLDMPEPMRCMAAITSADIVGSAFSRRAVEVKLSLAVARCDACRHKEVCLRWLDLHDGQRVTVPEFCANRAIMQPDFI